MLVPCSGKQPGQGVEVLRTVDPAGLRLFGDRPQPAGAVGPLPTGGFTVGVDSERGALEGMGQRPVGHRGRARVQGQVGLLGAAEDGRGQGSEHRCADGPASHRGRHRALTR